jgi:hypothetical protein
MAPFIFAVMFKMFKGCTTEFFYTFSGFVVLLKVLQLVNITNIYSIVENMHTAYEYKIVAFNIINEMCVATEAPTTSFKAVPV